MQLTTNTDKTFEVYFAERTRISDQVIIEMHDERPLPEIAADFYGLESLTVTDETKGTRILDQVNTLIGVQMIDDEGRVQITLKGATKNGSTD